MKQVLSFKEKVWVPSLNPFVFQESKEPQTGKISYKMKGLMLPFDVISRNGVLYNKDSVQGKCEQLTGRPLMYNHQVDGRGDLPYGHFTQSLCMDNPIPGWEKVYTKPGWYYEADIDPQEKDIIRKLERGDLRHVSIQLIGDRVEEKFGMQGEYTEAWVGDIIEGSIVPAPGFLDTTASFTEAFKGKEALKVGDKVNFPGGFGKILSIKGDKIIVRGEEGDMEFDTKEVHKEAIKKEDMDTTTAAGAVAPAKLSKKEAIDQKSVGFQDEKKEHPEMSDDVIRQLVADHLKIDPSYYSKSEAVDASGPMQPLLEDEDEDKLVKEVLSLQKEVLESILKDYEK